MTAKQTALQDIRKECKTKIEKFVLRLLIRSTYYVRSNNDVFYFSDLEKAQDCAAHYATHVNLT